MSSDSTTRPAGKPPSMALGIGLAVAILLIVVGAALATRRNEQLPSTYGKRRGREAVPSVNGTAVLGELFRQQGHRVTTFGRLSPRLEDFDVIVWTPNDFEPPTREQREFLEDWLAAGTDRTVIYIGRDYDAAVDYWDRMAPLAPAAQADEALRRRAEARAAHDAARSAMPTKEYARWFTARRDEKPLRSGPLSGPWAEGLDADKADLRLDGRLAIPTEGDRGATDPDLLDDYETLLAIDGQPLVYRITDDEDLGDGQIIVIANGSPVLNYPLVNHEHRKIAYRLVEECGAEGRVVFIESGPGGPPVLDKEPRAGAPPWWQQWPFSAILPHLALLAIVLCLARSPIFGRPRELPAEPASDFGKHVAALGQLLARTQDRNYAQARLAHYRQIAERKSGRSHLKGR
jgi:hypothetical protein